MPYGLFVVSCCFLMSLCSFHDHRHHCPMYSSLHNYLNLERLRLRKVKQRILTIVITVMKHGIIFIDTFTAIFIDVRRERIFRVQRWWWSTGMSENIRDKKRWTTSSFSFQWRRHCCWSNEIWRQEKETRGWSHSTFCNRAWHEM